MTNRVTALSGVQKKNLWQQPRSVFLGLTTPLVQPKEGSHTQPCQKPFQAAGDELRGAHCKHFSVTEHWISLSCGYPALKAAQAVPHLLHHKFARDFLSISKFFRGFSGCQSAATTLRRKAPAGRMLISAGRQEGERSWGARADPARRDSPSSPAALLPGATQSLAATSLQPQLQAPHCPRTRTGGTCLKAPCGRDTFLLNCFTALGAHFLYSDGSSLTSNAGFLMTTHAWLVFCLPQNVNCTIYSS